MIKKASSHSTFKLLAFFIIALGSFYTGLAFAQGANNIGDIAAIIVGSFQNIGKLMIATSYMAGIGFTIGAIFKFKQHRDNPTQIPIGAPIALLAIGVVMIFLPGVIGPIGVTIFGGSEQSLQSMAGGFKGGGANNLPGANL